MTSGEPAVTAKETIIRARKPQLMTIGPHPATRFRRNKVSDARRRLVLFDQRDQLRRHFGQLLAMVRFGVLAGFDILFDQPFDRQVATPRCIILDNVARDV